MENLESYDKAELYQNIIENNWDAIVFADMTGTVQFVNPAANELYGYEANELVGQNVDIFNSHLTHNTEDIVNSLIEKGRWYGELIQRRKDDSTFDALLHVQIIKDQDGNPIGYASNSKDISQDKVTAKKLKQIINEKEILIREIHHRVKNNLSIVQGMLRLQQSSHKQISLEEFLIDFQTRLSVLSEVHNNLSATSSSIQEISLDAYLKKIINDVVYLFDKERSGIELQVDLDPSVVLIDLAIPCGLIVNEVITNSFKHALKDSGRLEVTMKITDGIYQLTIKDNGPGFDPEASGDKSLGMSLVQGLVDQLDGKSQYESNENGTTFSLTFRP